MSYPEYFNTFSNKRIFKCKAEEKTFEMAKILNNKIYLFQLSLTVFTVHASNEISVHDHPDLIEEETPDKTVEVHKDFEEYAEQPDKFWWKNQNPINGMFKTLVIKKLFPFSNKVGW